MAKTITKTVKPSISDEVSEIIAEYKKLYDRDPTATVAEIQKLWDDSDDGIGAQDVNDFEGDNADDDDTPASALVSPSVKAAVTAVTKDKGAVELAHKLAKSPELLKHLGMWVENEAQRKRLPCVIALDFQAALTKDDIQGAPEPGSRYNDEGIGNAKFDVRPAGEGSYYAEVADDLPEGQKYTRIIDALREAMREGGIIAPEYKGKSPDWLGSELTTIKVRRDALKNAVKRAMTLCKRMFALPDETLLKARFRTENMDNTDPKSIKQVMRTSVPIEVYYYEGEGDERHMIPKYVGESAFNRVDFAAIGKLATAKDQLTAFAATRSRGNGNDDEANNVVIQNSRQFESACAEFAAMADDTKMLADLRLELSKPESMDFRLSLFATAKLFDRLVGTPSLRKLHTDDVNAKLAAMKTAEEQAA